VDPPGDSSTGLVGSVELPAPGRMNQLRWLNVTGHSSGLETITLMISRSLLSSPKGVTSELSQATAIGPTGCDHPSGRYGCAESVLLLVMPKQREQNDDRNWDAEQPQKQSASKAHCYFLLIRIYCGSSSHSEPLNKQSSFWFHIFFSRLTRRDPNYCE
jgi:hypothetical protein